MTVLRINITTEDGELLEQEEVSAFESPVDVSGILDAIRQAQRIMVARAKQAIRKEVPR